MPVAVESTAITAASTATQSVGSMAKGQTHTRIGIERAIAATLCTCLYGGMLFLSCNDVDGTAEALAAIDTAGGSLKYLDALYGMTLEEAAAYSGIGTGKLREITNEEGCNFVLWVGTKRLIKKRLFDQFIERSYSI